MRTFLLILAVAGIPLACGAHETFLTPHLHEHSHEVHDAEAEHEASGKGGEAISLETHEHAGELRLHATTGLRHTRYRVEGGSADLLETGIGVAFDVLPWLQLSAEGRYGWFESDAESDDGWLPPAMGIEAHLPVADHWEIGLGLRTQFPGVEPLGSNDEWELEPQLEVRYDRGRWYAAASAGVIWVLGSGAHHHADDGHDHGAGEGTEHDEEEHHEGEDEAGAEPHQESATAHDTHSEIHEIIEQHGDSEFIWQAALGVRVLDERVTLEGRLSGTHIIDGDTDARHYLRAGARVIYRVTETASLLLDSSVPVSGPRRNEFQTSLALRLSF